jgi:hypothetical protein
MKYETIVANDAETLDERVQEKLNEGWEPLGGVAVTHWSYDESFDSFTQTGFQYVQAMIKRESTLERMQRL